MTGSPVGQNYFRVTRLQNGTETEIFTVDLFSEWIGRIVDNILPISALSGPAIPGRETASNWMSTRPLSQACRDVFLRIHRFPPIRFNSHSSMPPAEPGWRSLDRSDGPGVILTPMNNTGNNYWGQILPDDIPASICIKDTTPV